jgi:predicted  nucleic acid-binding Zn-ribbon protein
MKTARLVPVALVAAAALAACNGEVKQQLATVQHVDSLRVDSLSNIRKELLEEVMTSTQFINQINTELAKAKALSSTTPAQLETNSEMSQVNEERKRVMSKITHLVARLDSVQSRVAGLRSRVAQLSQKDSALVAQVAAYEKTISDLQASAEKQRAEFQGVIDKQTTQIAELTSTVDTLNHVKLALTDTVSQLTTEKNTAYYVIGTKDELIQKGILVEEGRKRFFLVGGRKTEPARNLDPSAFTKIDRLANRTISLPEGEYEIWSRQDPTYAQPQQAKDGKIAGGLTIDQPERFWAPSRYLIIVRS